VLVVIHDEDDPLIRNHGKVLEDTERGNVRLTALPAIAAAMSAINTGFCVLIGSVPWPFRDALALRSYYDYNTLLQA
jgi:hypothetical protein